MCDCNAKCFIEIPPVKYRELTLLLLDCWQREYDMRPYQHLKFYRLIFEERMKRLYDPVKDFAVIIEFIRLRPLKSVSLRALTVDEQHPELIQEFVQSLLKIKRIKLKIMNIPNHFFELLAHNAAQAQAKELILSGTPLNDCNIWCLRSFLITSTTLHKIKVNTCGITQYNFPNLADGVHKSQSVISFDASRLLGGHLTLDTEKTTMTLASLVFKNQLQELILEECELIAQDMEYIAEYIYDKRSKLTKLTVAYNKIGPDGARVLLEAISHSGTLKSLDMSGCGLGIHGGEYVAKYLSSCSRLESIYLSYNEMSPETVTLILLTIKKPLKITKITLWGNRYNPRTGTTLRRLIEARVLPQDFIDITYTFDDTIPGYRVIPWRPSINKKLKILMENSMKI